MLRNLSIFLSIYIVTLISTISHAKSYEYNLPFRRAQAWADFFVIELNNEILKISMDGQFSSANYQLPLDHDCEITAMNYRPIVPEGQILFNYEVQCDQQQWVKIVKVEKVGTVVKEMFHLPYGEKNLGAGLWLDELLVLTSQGTIFILNHKDLDIAYFNPQLENQFQAVLFTRVETSTKGFEFTYDSTVPHDSRKKLCLNWPERYLHTCR